MTWALVIMSLVCAIIGGLVTNRKGRGTWPGAALGLLLGLIGVLVAVLLPRRPA